MHLLFILLVILIGGAFVGLAIAKAIGSVRFGGRKRLMSAIGGVLLAFGGLGFFGSALSACGGLNWLPQSFEWPVGYGHNVVEMPGGIHVVGHSPSGRIQVYDRDWKFLRGWPVDASAGAFIIRPAGTNRIDVMTARHRMRYQYDSNGSLLSSETYAPGNYSDFSGSGQSAQVPTHWWLWTFTNPIYSWIVVVIGIIFLNLASRGKRN